MVTYYSKYFGASMEVQFGMKKCTISIGLFLVAAWAGADVRVFVQDDNGVARIQYQCTAGEVVRAFALDVSVDRGQIVGVSDFFRGESRAEAQGYGIFPASFRDHITVGSGTNLDWNVTDYTPVAAPGGRPGETLPGLNSGGVTLEFGGLWNPNVPATIPGPTGALCALQISEAAQVSVALNASRGGIVSALPEIAIVPVLTGAFIDPAVAITSIRLENGVVTIHFKGGELETATTVDGVWTRTGNTSGLYSESLGPGNMKFYRAHRF